jgi:hypothetical protein
MSIRVPLYSGVLPSSCYSNFQGLSDDIMSYGYGLIDGATEYIVSETAPGADDQGKLWIQVNSKNQPIRQWIYSGGAWIWPHPVPPNDQRLQMFYGSAAEVDTLDGGVAGTAGAKSGPFWEIYDSMATKFPMGVGTLDDGTSVAVTNTGGQERVTLTSTQVPDHQHKGKAYYKASGGTAGSDESGLMDNLYHENSGHTTTSSTTSVAAAGVLTSETVGTIGESHPNLPPYYGVYFIKRTGRQFYTAS